MAKYPVVLDLETKYTFREFADPKKLEISVVGIYDYNKNSGATFLENELNKLFPILEGASYLIGYNIKTFDLPVLQAYYPGRVEHFPVFDILDYIKQKIGKRIALNEVVLATLGKKKSGHGLMAIDYYKEGKWEELKSYCLDDAMLTKEVFEFGVKQGEIYYLNEKGKIAIPTDWKKYQENSQGKDMSLTLPF